MQLPTDIFQTFLKYGQRTEASQNLNFEHFNESSSGDLQAFVEFIKTSQEKLEAAINQSLISYYKGAYNDYLDGFTDGTMVPNEISKECLPELVNGDEIFPCFQYDTFTLHSYEDGQYLYGIEFFCTWDDEHGLGVLMKGTEVVNTGFANTALDLDY